MEDKRELNDIFINGDKGQYQSRNKKIVLLVAAAVLLFIFLVAITLAISSDDEEAQIEQTAKLNGLEQPADEFKPVGAEPANGEDRFKSILESINNKAQEESAQEPKPAPAPSVAPAQTQIAAPVQIPESNLAQVAKQEQKEAAKQAQQEPAKPAPAAQSAEPAKTAQTSAQAPVAQAPKPAAQEPKPAPAPKPAPTSSLDRSKNGQIAKTGHYFQVGSFEKEPNKDFMDKISKYSYRVYNEGGKTKYLIGPYTSRTEANRDSLKMKTEWGDETFFFEVK